MAAVFYNQTNNFLTVSQAVSPLLLFHMSGIARRKGDSETTRNRATETLRSAL